MGLKVITWDRPRTKMETNKRFRNASNYRTRLEDRWIRNERTIYSTSSPTNITGAGMLPEETMMQEQGVDGSSAESNTAFVFKNFRFIHAQMSANPPIVAMRPTSSDQEDHRKADAADRIARWALRRYNLQELQDQMNLHALLYGTGLIKTVWDSTRGDITGFDEESGELELEGDICISVPFLWNIYIDPDARSWQEVKFLFEKIYMDYDEACARWPERAEILKAARLEESESSQSGKQTQIQNMHYNCVELLEYWETGLPTNGYMGRYCITTCQGEVIEECRPSPFRFKRAGAVSKIENDDTLSDDEKEAKLDRLPEQASLPYHILTDVDMPNMVYGRSNIEYVSMLQDNLNCIDSTVLDNIQAHGVARMVVPEGVEVNEDALSNSPWDVTRVTSSQTPFFVKPPELMPDMTRTRDNLKADINDVQGVNESMFGQQSRETSSAAMQYATNQGNMVRRRLFNKYTLAVESLYRAILNLVRKHWTTERTINVIGKEKALEAIDLKGADIDGGYDVVGEYGTSLSLDPITRREEILSLQPLFEKAGVNVRKTLEMLKLNELEGMYDELDIAGSRQKEIFDEMIAKQAYIPPKKFRDHENMIAWAMRYFMSQEFESLPEEIQALCERHIEERAQVAATENPPPAPPGSPGPAPAGPVGPAAGSVPPPAAQPTPQAA